MLDLLTVKFLSTYSTRPIHVFGSLGLLSTFAGTVLTGYLGFQRLFFNVGLEDRPILLLGILLVVVGIQFITMGLLGEMLVRVYHEAQGKPIYVVREILTSSSHPSPFLTIPQLAGLPGSSIAAPVSQELEGKRKGKAASVHPSPIRT
jgi:hypothetical protein